jgi:hypothetical protein
VPTALFGAHHVLPFYIPYTNALNGLVTSTKRTNFFLHWTNWWFS